VNPKKARSTTLMLFIDIKHSKYPDQLHQCHEYFEPYHIDLLVYYFL